NSVAIPVIQACAEKMIEVLEENEQC
ncbi:hypothetical protein SFB3_210G0, partial [Candidatus Arthromitus sp. SFB-3]